jgi:hypothetical protein
MAGKRHDDGRVCLCDRPDGTCAGLAVQRLSRDRVRDLAEEIWTASSGYLPPVRALPDPRSSRAGASAETAYRRRREQERATCHLVLHDITLPGWLDSVDHLVLGPTGVWVAESLDGWATVPVRALLCVHSPWSVSPQTSGGLRVAALGQLPGIVRSGPTTPPGELEQATSRLLEVLRPAA